ncbi:MULTISPECIES: secondary thiamine-phosphate synthase enzyme YjbQ [unclassified Methylophilus]|jgi:secondary thiamine-phosphate synthase enzyme|uniref:Secondary thiamine-phosphate synthase enzyme YjbQ n=1 Tax=Methylophilus glucosoxydans TaxID=752553 RepID=A0ABW3GGC3_9PROT|nr:MULTISPECIES: secondary thiamine-phosphate synthase enzyme YjbQ [unclassified Methylophilus]BEV08897.1 secondary thiamine-phosphate synthase enzyme YjbQ [Methylophilus sp. DW102]MBF4987039.1 YjbQ family protein [Methylophilus sp. 14]MBF5039475.1 YjbQ family protein [Methylophilus sp. 13]MDF0377613.1 YjbQ family protein [Methylophilus sp. YYY-1]MDT7849864.1 secondary thiamine-phosphate synthase enzyme YjbQ [Methylophilus sp. VKM B-3414]
MRQQHETLSINAQGRRLYDITPQVLQWVQQSGIQSGLLTLYIQHTSASLLINENYDRDVLVDLEAFFNRLVPDGDDLFIHTVEGPDDMPAHVRTALTQTSLSIPVLQGRVALGQWQGIFLFEHRHLPARRRVLMHVMGE